MTALDLEHDSPEDFEGKLVVIEGCRYRVGPFLGVGAEAIVHTLINCRSGLPLLIIRIPRDQSTAAATDYTEQLRQLGYMKAAEGLSDKVANLRFLALHGGVFEIQDNLGAGNDDPETSAVLDQAMSLFNKKAYEAAEQIYTGILQRNPSETTALVGLAATLTMTGRAWDAVPVMEEVLTIEPNFCNYYLSYISVLSNCPHPRAIIDIAERMKSLFPYQCILDETIAEAYLDCGLPRQAQQLMATSLIRLDIDVKRSLDERIRLHLEGAGAAAKFREIAKRAIGKRGFEKAATALQEAYRLDPYDPYSRANLAFTLRKNGEYTQAAVLLDSLQHLISSGYLHAIRFNTGLALLQAGENELAIKFLVSAVKLATSGSEGPITEGDLPGAGTWISEKFIQEEPVRTVFPILAQLAETDAANQAEVAWLLRQYADFADKPER